MGRIMARRPHRIEVLLAVVVVATLALATGSALALGPLVNINTAPKEAIEALPGISPPMAQAIIDGRPYQKTTDLLKVKGIQQEAFDKVKNLITVK
jgi:competence ComEA-like helix-hairpin-helix protein